MGSARDKQSSIKSSKVEDKSQNKENKPSKSSTFLVVMEPETSAFYEHLKKLQTNPKEVKSSHALFKAHNNKENKTTSEKPTHRKLGSF